MPGVILACIQVNFNLGGHRYVGIIQCWWWSKLFETVLNDEYLSWASCNFITLTHCQGQRSSGKEKERKKNVESYIFSFSMSWVFAFVFIKKNFLIWNGVDCQCYEKISKTHNWLKERFLIGWNRTKCVNFQASPLFQATYNIKTVSCPFPSASLVHLTQVGLIVFRFLCCT